MRLTEEQWQYYFKVERKHPELGRQLIADHAGRSPTTRPGIFAAYAAWSAREIELQALTTLATLAQISTPSAAHLPNYHQILVQKFAADQHRQKGPRSLKLAMESMVAWNLARAVEKDPFS